MSYYNISERLRYRPHDGATPEGWAKYEREVSARMAGRIIPELPPVPEPVKETPGMLERFRVPEHLKRIPFRKKTFEDPVTGHPLSQITFEDGWGDGERFHASVNYNYINPWNPGPVTDDSWIAVIAMNIAHPDYGNRVYVIRQDGKEARCLAVNCEFACELYNGKPYLHTAPIFWLDKDTIFFAQRNGISIKADIHSGELAFVPGVGSVYMGFPSRNGERAERMAYLPVSGCGQCFVYEFDTGENRKLCDLYDVMKLHPELDPNGLFQLSVTLANFQWSWNGRILDFFAMFFHNGRVIRDLCAVNCDGSDLHLVISSEDTLRYPPDGKKRKFGHLFPAGSILQNHQAILPGDKQMICCTQEPFALPPGKKPNPDDPFIDTRITLVADLDGSRIQLMQGDDLNFDGHPSSNPQGTLWLGSDYNYFIKIMDPATAHVTKIFSLETTDCNHPHETWSGDGRHILFRRAGRSGQLFTAPVGFLYLRQTR